jgi:glucose dehydrogenase
MLLLPALYFCQCYIMVTFFETIMVTFLLMKSHAFAIAGYNLLCFHASVVALWEHFSG